MRWAKSYSIVDHNLLHQGFLNRLSHEALVLYLFLVVVSDRDGRSFYNKSTIMEILRFSPAEYQKAVHGLIDSHLIEYRCPYFWIKNIEPHCKNKETEYTERPKNLYTGREIIQRTLRQLSNRDS